MNTTWAAGRPGHVHRKLVVIGAGETRCEMERRSSGRAYQVASNTREKGRREQRVKFRPYVPGCFAHAHSRATMHWACRGWGTRIRAIPRGGCDIAGGTGYAPAYVQIPTTHFALTHAGELAHFLQVFFFFLNTGRTGMRCIHQDYVPAALDALACARHTPGLHPHSAGCAGVH